MTTRHLRDDEKQLIRRMLEGIPEAGPILQKLDLYQVEEMKDGSMGSVRTIGMKPEKRHFGKVLAETQVRDEDDIPVIASIIADSSGDLFELDMWKVDFSPLRRFPEPPKR